jgi:heat-inducible transcriptional repressor
MLTERQELILRLVVEAYGTTAKPVPSKEVAERPEVGWGASTVRAELAALEAAGLLTHPHTSAGRVPTDRGYRFFVDHFAPISTLPSPQRREVSEFFSSATGVIDQLLHDTSQLLARITRHAAVVVGPTAEATVVRAVRLVPLDTVNVLVIAILGNGTVEREIVRFDDEIPHALIERAEVALAQKLVGTELADVVPSEPHASTDDEGPVRAGDADDIARVALDALVGRTTSSEPLFVGGASRLAAESEAFTSPESVSRLLGLLEQHVVVVGMMRELLGPGLTVTIGSEHKRSDLQECSLVLAPYLVDGAFAGTVGVLGPTRMDYRQAQAAVRTISQQLSRELSR